MASTPTAQKGLADVLRLYRAVLRVHRQKLPAPMRALGDSYARSEVRRHLDAKTTPAQWREFADQWGAYVSALSGRADADEDRGAAAPLHDAGGDALTAAQKAQLARLREAAAEMGGGGKGEGAH
jgi:hypothetical protein